MNRGAVHALSQQISLGVHLASEDGDLEANTHILYLSNKLDKWGVVSSLT